MGILKHQDKKVRIKKVNMFYYKEKCMNSLNSILVEGNLTRDPELKKTPRGTSVCSFSLASNRFFRQDDETQKEVSFFNVESWAGLADICMEHLNKGRGVRVVGRLKQDRWVDQDGKNHDRVKIVAEHVEFKPLFTKNLNSENEQDASDIQGKEENGDLKAAG